MLRKYFASIIFILTSVHLAFSQSHDDYLPAVLVNVNGDTIHGEIKVVRDDRFSKSIMFYRNGSDLQEKFSPKDIRYFRFEDQEYVSRNIDGKDYFVKRVIGGELSLYEYAFREKKGTKSEAAYRYFVDKQSTNEWVEISSKILKYLFLL
ncbi:MAG: hypothetical protein LC101_08485 [Flavobacteriales bacterium]|nr:hypothetical protein [Flavobacteriales bacterium]